MLFVVLFHILINYGIPAKIKADNRNSFSANNVKDKKLFITQFGRICEELNIVLETTSIATAKANVERENGTFIVNYDGNFYSEIENHYYQMIELENRDSIMIKETEIKGEKKEHHKYVPPANHPWRKI